MPIYLKSKATGLLILIGIFWVLFNPPQSISSAERKVCPKVEPKVEENNDRCNSSLVNGTALYHSGCNALSFRMEKAITLKDFKWKKFVKSVEKLYQNQMPTMESTQTHFVSVSNVQNVVLKLDKKTPNPLIVKRPEPVKIVPAEDKPVIVKSSSGADYYQVTEEWKQVIANKIMARFNDSRVVQLAYCESGLNPAALNRVDTNGHWSAGIFQINGVHGQTPEHWFDIDRKYRRRGTCLIVEQDGRLGLLVDGRLD